MSDYFEMAEAARQASRDGERMGKAAPEQREPNASPGYPGQTTHVPARSRLED